MKNFEYLNKLINQSITFIIKFKIKFREVVWTINFYSIINWFIIFYQLIFFE